MADTVSFYFFSRGAERSVHRPVKNREERITLENGLNGAQRLNPSIDCYVDVKPTTHQTSFFLHDFCTSRPKRDLLLCVARHTAVTLTRNAPLFRAQGPGISVSRVEPSGVFFSRFCQSSSRSLGRCLLLGQRSRMNLFSYLIGSLFHQHHRNPYRELTRDRYNGDSGSDLARVFAANRAEKLPELTVLSDRRPGGLDEFASQPFISSTGDRPPINSLPGGMLGGHQAQKPSQLTDVVKLSPIADAGQELAG